MNNFQIIFEPINGTQRTKSVWVKAEDAADIDVCAIGDNIDTVAYNSADWHMRDAFGKVVRCCDSDWSQNPEAYAAFKRHFG